MLIKVDRPDLAWQVAIQRREAILWIGSAFSHLRQADRLGALEEVLLCPWAAVYVDADRLPLLELIERHRQIGSLVLRVFDDASPGALPPNRLPIYRLRGPKGSVGPGATSDPAALLARYAMLKQAPVGLEVFALGIETPEDTAALLEAVSLAPEAFGRLVVTSPAPPDLAPVGAKASRVICWCARRDEFVRVLPPPGASGEAADAHILVQTATGPQQVDLGPCIEPGHPITTAFQFVSAGEILAETRPNEEMVRAFLADPAGSWLPYAAGIPYPRHRPYEKLLLKELKKFGREGPAASCTAWLAAEDGSGATTVLRQVCLDIARQGYPVLVARGNAPSFDFQQVSGFLTRATDRLAAAGVSVPDLPWVIAFDAEHTQLHWEFLSGVANGLKNLQKPVLVLAVRPLGVRYDARATPSAVPWRVGGKQRGHSPFLRSTRPQKW